MANLGPASTQTVNTQSPRSTEVFIQTIAVSLTPVAIGAAGSAEQSFGLNGASQVTAATGILAGDVILSVNSPSVVAAVALANFRVDTAVNDKIYLTFLATAAATPAAGTYLITVARFSLSASTTPGTLTSLPTSITLN